MLSSFAFVNASLETSLRQNQLLMTSRILSPADPHILNISMSFNYSTCLAEFFFFLNVRTIRASVMLRFITIKAKFHFILLSYSTLLVRFKDLIRINQSCL